MSETTDERVETPTIETADISSVYEVKKKQNPESMTLMVSCQIGFTFCL